jgi:hypothetical protein
MSGGSLSPLQHRVLELLAGMDPPWTLTGGAALVAVHLGHRQTRDLDLFWRGQPELADAARLVRERLTAGGLAVTVVQTGASFERLLAADDFESVVVDLVADPTPPLEAPMTVLIGTAPAQVDTPHEILVNKLCTLLGRRELRDLMDVRALLAAGGDMPRALTDAPRKDGGFSPLTLAWAVRGWPVEQLAAASGLSTDEAAGLAEFRDDMIRQLTDAAAPE